jgi:hypothetical protein
MRGVSPAAGATGLTTILMATRGLADWPAHAPLENGRRSLPRFLLKQAARAV